MDEFDRLVVGVEELTGQTPRFKDKSEVLEAELSIMLVDDGVKVLGVVMPPELTFESVDNIRDAVKLDWYDQPESASA